MAECDAPGQDRCGEAAGQTDEDGAFDDGERTEQLDLSPNLIFELLAPPGTAKHPD